MFLLQLGTSAPLNEGNYTEASWFTPLMQFHDRWGFIAWPVLAIVVIGFVAWGVLRSASHQTIPGSERMKVKREVVAELRRQIHGLSLEQLAAHVGHPAAPMQELLEEMVNDGMIGSGQSGRGTPVYKTRGY